MTTTWLTDWYKSLPVYRPYEPCAKCGSCDHTVRHNSRIEMVGTNTCAILASMDVTCNRCGHVRYRAPLDAKPQPAAAPKEAA